jgi:hypothetical protein
VGDGSCESGSYSGWVINNRLASPAGLLQMSRSTLWCHPGIGGRPTMCVSTRCELTANSGCDGSLVKSDRYMTTGIGRRMSPIPRCDHVARRQGGRIFQNAKVMYRWRNPSFVDASVDPVNALVKRVDAAGALSSNMNVNKSHRTAISSRPVSISLYH